MVIFYSSQKKNTRVKRRSDAFFTLEKLVV